MNVPQEVIEPRLLGDYRGATFAGASLPVRFFDEAGMNYPLPADGLWFLTGLLSMGHVEEHLGSAESITTAVSQTELYRQAAASLGDFSASSTFQRQ